MSGDVEKRLAQLRENYDHLLAAAAEHARAERENRDPEPWSWATIDDHDDQTVDPERDNLTGVGPPPVPNS